MIKRKLICFMILISLMAGLFAGCGKEKESGNAPTAEKQETTSLPAGFQDAGATNQVEWNTEAPAEEFPGDRAAFDLLTQEWKDADERTDVEKFWTPTEYGEDFFEQPAGLKYANAACSAVDGGTYYLVMGYLTDPSADEIYATGSDVKYFLNSLETETLDARTVEIDMAELLEKGYLEHGRVVGFDAAGGELMIFVQQFDGDYDRQSDPDAENLNTLHYYAVRMTADGRADASSAVDLLPAISSAKIEDESVLYRNAGYDSRGYFYFRDTEGKRVVVMDGKGELLTVMSAADAGGDMLKCTCKTPEGVAIWESDSREAEETDFWFFDGEKMGAVGKAPYEMAECRFVNPYGEMIFPRGDNLIRRNIGTGSYERLSPGSNEVFQSSDAILQNSKGKVVIVKRAYQKVSYSTYTSAGPAEKVVLSPLASSVDYYIKSWSSDFCRKHPGVIINLKEASGDYEDRWNSIAMEFVSGKAPDMVLLDREHMLILQEKGALADLTGVIPAETEKQIFKGVLENGRVDGRTYMINYSASIQTNFASKKYCPNGVWTIEEVLDVIDGLERSGHPVTSLVNAASSDEPAAAMLRTLIYDIENSPFLDAESGKARFDTPEFKRLLETCKKYGTPENEARDGGNVISNQLKEDETKYVREGAGLLYNGFGGVQGLSDFSEALALLGEDFVAAGYPTNAASGSFLRCYDGVAVNANAQHRDVIDEFLRYLLGAECQKQAYFIVRRDLVEDTVSIWENPNTGEKTGHIWISDNSERPLALKPDGTAYLEEYFALLDNSRPAPAWDNAVKTIVYEEAQYYFDGNKSVEDVMNIIQNRVQLYLNERN